MAKNLEPVSGELRTSTYPNRFNVVIPIEAPFYRTGLVITAPGRPLPLIEGLDYYLGYYYQEAAEAFKEAVYGGIILLHETAVEYEIVPIGREYRIPSSEIAKWLVKTDLADPRNIDWATLMRFAPTIPAIDPPQSLEEAILRDEVVAALHELTVVLKEQATEMEGAYDACAVQLTKTGKKIYEDGLYQHHLKPNAHPYTGNNLAGSGLTDVNGTGTYLRGDGEWVETYSAAEFDVLLAGGTVPDGVLLAATGDNCLMVAARAVDATLAFGRTFNQLLDVMSTAGIQQRDIDALMGLTLGDLYGRLSVENNNTLTYKTANDNHVIEFNGGSILLRTKLRMDLTGDRDNNEPGIGVEVGAGLNTLMVHSGPDAVAPVYNGVFLITPEQVKLYIHSLILQTANAYFQSSTTLDIVGTGKQVAPVMMTAKPPVATTAAEGLFALSNVPTPAPLPGVALSQSAVTGVRDDLENYVDDTFTINGKTFNKTTQNLDLTKADFQLGNVQNTNPAEKPVSTALAAALALKALLTHTHTLADLINVPTASGTVPGMMQLHDAIDATADKAVTAKQGYLLDQKIQTSEDKAQVLLPSWAVIGSQYGKPGFMPIPAQGNYEGYIRTGNPFCALRRDGDTLFVLRNGWTGFPNTEAIYYAYALINADGSIARSTQTSFKYHPAGMTEKYPGITLKEHRFSDADCGIFMGSDNRYYAVLFEGSMDYRKHTKVVRLNPLEFRDINDQPYITSLTGESWNCFVYNGAMYLVANSVGTGIYRMVLANIPLTEFGEVSADVTIVPLTGSKFKQSIWNMFFKDQTYTPTEDPDVMAWATPEGLAKWSTRNLIHGPMPTRMVGVEDGKLRVGFQLTYYLAGAVASNWGRSWYTSYLVDLEAKTVVLENAHQFPMRLDENGIHYKDQTANANQGTKLAYHYANLRANSIYDGQFFYIAACDQTPGTTVVVNVQAAPVSLFQLAKWDYAFSEASTQGGIAYNSGMGSVYRNSMTHPLFLGGDTKAMVLVRANDPNHTILMEYNTDNTYGVPGYSGFGPSNNRSTIPPADYEALSKMALVKTDKNAQEFLDGATFIGPATVKTRNVAGTASISTSQVSISQAEWDKLIAAVRTFALTQSGAATGYLKEYLEAAEAAMAGGQPGNVLYALWVVGTSLAGGPLCLVGMATQHRREGTNKSDVYTFLVTPAVDAQGNMTFNVPNVRTHMFQNNVMNTADSGIVHSIWSNPRRPGQVFLISSDGVNFVMNIPSFFGANTIGGSGNWGWRGRFTRSGNSWGGTGGAVWWDQPSYSPNRFAYVKHLGGVVQYSFELTTAAVTGTLFEYDDWIANTLPPGSAATAVAKVILGAMETAEGWIMYITEEVYLYVKQHPIQVPSFEMDLSVAFAGNCANKTFHVHVEGYEETGIWKGRYIVGFTRLPDTDTRLYVGTVVTDDKRIIQMDLRRAKRLGRVRPLLEHALDATRHDNSNRLAKQFSPLGITKSAPVDVVAPELSYATQTGAAKRLTAQPAMVSIPAPIGSHDWSMSPVEKFWQLASVMPITSPAWQALGMMRIQFGGNGVMQAGEQFGHKVNITSTKAQIRIKFARDDGVRIFVDGVLAVPNPAGNTAGEFVSDLTLTPGAHTVAFEVTESPGFTPCFVGYIIYDWDGTTERELVRSGAASKVGILTPVLPRHKSGCVIRANQLSVAASATVLGVTDVVTGQGVPFVVEPNGPLQTVYYATEWYPEGSSTKRVLGQNDAVVNLMIAPSI